MLLFESICRVDAGQDGRMGKCLSLRRATKGMYRTLLAQMERSMVCGK